MAGYNYLQHLTNTKINLTAYLDEFSDDNYDLSLNNQQPVITTLPNLFQHMYLVRNFKDKGASFSMYNVQDGELPEDVALKFYGNVSSWWVIFLFNDIKNPFTEWPLSQEQILYLRDVLVAKENLWSSEGYYRLLADKNEERSRIEILKPEQVPTLVKQFSKAIIGGNSTQKITSTTVLL